MEQQRAVEAEPRLDSSKQEMTGDRDKLEQLQAELKAKKSKRKLGGGGYCTEGRAAAESGAKSYCCQSSRRPGR